MTMRQMLNEGWRFLDGHQVDDPRSEAVLLLAFVLGKPREYVYVETDFCLSAEQEESYRQVLARRAQHVPYAYIVGFREFMGLAFSVNEAVLIPRPETETLVETVLAQKDLLTGCLGGSEAGCSETAEGLSLLDMCTGSGAVAVSLAVRGPEWARVIGADISEKALKVARGNARRLGVSVSWRCGDLWAAMEAGERFDCITVNPPYVSEAEYDVCSPEVRREPRLALWGGADGLDFYRRIAGGAANHLKPGGRLYLEIGWRQAEDVCELLRRAGFNTEVLRDLAGRDRVVVAWKEVPKNILRYAADCREDR